MDSVWSPGGQDCLKTLVSRAGAGTRGENPGNIFV